MAISPQDIALAIEGINRIPDLSPLARRLCHELIGRTDRKSRMCFPSEARLALSLDCDERSIRRAKAELRERGFLTWRNRGRHKTPLYLVMFTVIVELARDIKRRIRQACEPLAKAEAAKQEAKKQPQPSPAPRSPAPDNSGRTVSSAFPSQGLNINRALEKGRSGGFRTPSGLTEHQKAINANTRLWKDIWSLPGYISEMVAERLSPEQMENALQAEQRRFGSGKTVIFEALGLTSQGALEGGAS